mmetsp:Transcript_21810/g.62549  ORF Transcript_21810/g.62549 Transcript_21810/m.62549 type:complete len:896 (+) Transcript_21810:222-2909(+)
MSRPTLVLLVISCYLLASGKSAARQEATHVPSLQSTYHLHHKGFAVRFVSSKQFLGMPRGGETSRGTDQMATAPLHSDRGQLQDRFSFISAVRALHKRSMLVKDEAETTSAGGGNAGTHGLNSATGELSGSSSSPNSADDDQDNNDNTTDVAVEDVIVEEKDSQAREQKGSSERRYYQSSGMSPSKSRRVHRSVRERNTKRDKNRQSGSPRVDACHVQSSLKAEHETLGKDIDRNATKDSASSTGLDGNVSMLLHKTESPTRSENIGMSLYSNSKESNESMYISSGYWHTIDKVLSLGKSATNPNLRLSRHLRPVRKMAAQMTGLHGVMSLKNCTEAMSMGNKTQLRDEIGSVLQVRNDVPTKDTFRNSTAAKLDKRNFGQMRRGERVRRFGRFLPFGRRNRITHADNRMNRVVLNDMGSESISNAEAFRGNTSIAEITKKKIISKEIRRRTGRVKEIDRLINSIQKEVVELQCEKDDLQRRPNPLYNYTGVWPSEKHPDGGKNSSEIYLMNRTIREFNFPPPEFAEAYIEDLVDSGRLIMLNHTQLWQRRMDDFDGVGDDIDELTGGLANGLSSPSNGTDPRSGSRSNDGTSVERKNKNSRGSSGSWLLRQSLGRGLSLGEKIGETVELAAYKAVCASVMSILARSVSALHGVNVMTHSDIRIFVETVPDLPPLAKGSLPDEEKYAEEAIRKAIRRSAKKRKKRSKNNQGRSSQSADGYEAFLQRDAVIETLISHCQISAPLLKLFPLSWQRALLGNIITLVAAIVSDFVDGIQIHILGHQLSLSFKPITEKDVMNSVVGFGTVRHRASVEEFEAAVEATARDVSKSLEFLDRWHERALGGGVLRAQIGNLVARIVLTLTDEVLGGAKFDLWSAQIGGPRIVAGLEYRRVEEDA